MKHSRKQKSPEDFQALLQVHDLVSATIRAELAQRSAGEVLYDDFLLEQLRKGKSFAVALSEANAKYPTEALSPSAQELRKVEARYRYQLNMEELDEHRRKFHECNEKVKAIDAQIATLMDEIMKHHEDDSNPGPTPS